MCILHTEKGKSYSSTAMHAPPIGSRSSPVQSSHGNAGESHSRTLMQAWEPRGKSILDSVRLVSILRSTATVTVNFP